MNDDDHIGLGGVLDLGDIMVDEDLGGDGALEIGDLDTETANAPARRQVGEGGLEAEENPPEDGEVAPARGPLAMPGSIPLKFGEGTPELMSHARSVRAEEAAKAKSQQLQAQLEAQHASIKSFARILPGAAILVGKPGAASAVGRIPVEKLNPKDLWLICMALHMPFETRFRVGLDNNRLLCWQQGCVEQAAEGLQELLARGVSALARAVVGRRCIHIKYNYMWDEVSARFRFPKSNKYRRPRTSVHLQTLVQKGQVTITLSDLRQQRSRSYVETWLFKPVRVPKGQPPSPCPSSETKRLATSCCSSTSAVEAQDPPLLKPSHDVDDRHLR